MDSSALISWGGSYVTICNLSVRLRFLFLLVVKVRNLKYSNLCSALIICLEFLWFFCECNIIIYFFGSNEFLFLFFFLPILNFKIRKLVYKAILNILNRSAEIENWQVFNVILLYEQVADLGLLRAETHKFESHYIDNLVGKLKNDIWHL